MTAVLTFWVRPLAMTGPTMPGMVAKELVMPNIMPAYLEKETPVWFKV